MSEINYKDNFLVLQRIAREAMIDRGLIPDFPPEVIDEVNKIQSPAQDNSVIDLRNLLWCSIDNEDSNDLDQLSVAVKTPEGDIKILVAIADVDALVKKGSEIDLHASKNTATVYTPVKIFSMLPEKLSTNFTSLNYQEDRLAVVFEMSINEDGSLKESNIYRATVRNYAKLAYNNVSAWLDGQIDIPDKISKVNGLAENIKQQYQVAKKMKEFRDKNGAINFERIKAYPVFTDSKIELIQLDRNNGSKAMIEDFMISVNGIAARYLKANNYPSVRRVVRTPKRWNRIVEIATTKGYSLSVEPDPKALDQFLIWAKNNDPENFSELSLSILKLLGPGEYVVEIPGGESIGHFGLALKDYSHSTAPNRRYPDVLTQRLLKSALTKSGSPYTDEELEILTKHCTDAENASKKVQRQVEKSAYIILFQSKIGNEFDSIVTGSSSKGTWIRLLNYPVEGKLANPSKGTDVGDKVRVRLVYTNVEKGFIDFKEA